jgi:hypothetical protein
MGVNPGLKSRFSQRLHFPDFSPADAAQLLALQLRKEYALELDAGAAEALPGMAEQVRSSARSCRWGWDRRAAGEQPLGLSPGSVALRLTYSAAGGRTQLGQRARRGHLGQARLCGLLHPPLRGRRCRWR